MCGHSPCKYLTDQCLYINIIEENFFPELNEEPLFPETPEEIFS